MDITLHDKGAAFREMHLRSEILVLPNPWDVGTSRLLEHLGFEALATTSAGFAHSIGRPDGGIDRTEALRHATELARCTTLPVSADLHSTMGGPTARSSISTRSLAPTPTELCSGTA